MAAKQACDLHTYSLTQRLAFAYLDQPGALAAHLAELCAAYRLRRDAMLAALARDLPAGCRWTRPDGGLFLWVELPAHLDASDLLRAAVRRDVAFVPGASFWVGREVRHTLRLNFSNAPAARIAEGVSRLAEAIAELPGPAPQADQVPCPPAQAHA